MYKGKHIFLPTLEICPSYEYGLLLLCSLSICIFFQYRKNLTVFLYISLFIYLFIYGCVAQAFSSSGEQGLLFVAVPGLLITMTSLVVEHKLQVCGLQQLWYVGSVVVAVGFQQLWLGGSRAQSQQLWRTGLVAPQHVGSSWARV